ncbi:MAG: Clp protease N-terminal domain-containing protein [Acidimicrobiales bacterium]
MALIGRSDRPNRQPEALLAELGIDLVEVRRRVEATFGSEAMARASLRVRLPRRRWRHRLPWPARSLQPAPSTLLGIRGFGLAPRVKRVMELARQRAAPALANPAHLLSGIAEEGEGGACQILAARGIDVAALATESRTHFASASAWVTHDGRTGRLNRCSVTRPPHRETAATG